MSFADPKDFGAIADGATLDTAALQRAIDAAPRGVAVRLSGGTFRSGTLELHSGTILEIAPDAVLEGSPDIADYRDCGFHHREMGETLSLIFALGAEDAEIRGGGTIRFNGSAFMDWNAPPRFRNGAVLADPSPELVAETICPVRKRPSQPVFFDSCRHVRIHDVKAVDSPCWTFTFSDCEDVEVERVSIDNNLRISNSDGVHFSASRRIRVRDCDFSCGDDCFAATCITHPDGECRDILVERCRMRSRSAAIRVGHNASHVLFRDIEIADTNRGVCVYARKSGGAISDILFERLRAETRIFVGDWWGNGEPFVVSGAGAAGTIDGVTFRDCSFVCESPGLVMGEGGNVRGVALERCALRHEPGPAPSALRETMDLRPNVTLGAAPWVAGTVLFIRGAEASVRALPPPALSANGCIPSGKHADIQTCR